MAENIEDTRSALLHKIEAVAARIKRHEGSSCVLVIEELQRDPKFAAALDKVGYGIMRDIALVRAPVTGPFLMTRHVAEQANVKMQSGDVIGGLSNYSAAVAVGITSMVPFLPLGDLTIEGMRAMGVDLDISPIRQAYKTAVGAMKACDNLNRNAVNLLGLTHYPREQLLKGIKALDADEAKGVDALLDRMVHAYDAAEKQVQGKQSDSHTPIPPPAFSNGRPAAPTRQR